MSKVIDWDEVQKSHVAGDLHTAVEKLAMVLGGAMISHRKQAWERFCQPSENLLWQLASQSCRSGQASEAQKCLAAIGNFQRSNVKEFVARQYGSDDCHRLIAQVDIIEAAAATIADPDGTTARKYRLAAIEAITAAGSLFGSGTATGVVDLGIARLCGIHQAETPHAETWILLVDEGLKSRDIAARFVAELRPGVAGELLPDPFRNGIVKLSPDILMCIKDALG